MSLFDLLFLACAFALVVSFGRLLTHAVRRDSARLRTLATRIGVGIGVYFGALLAVSLLAPQRYIALGEPQCWDDWCAKIGRANRLQGADSSTIDVSFVLQNRAGRVRQRERGVVAYLVDDTGVRYDPVADAASVPFDAMLDPGEQRTATRRFRVPSSVTIAGVVLTKAGAGSGPGCCIIGDDASLLHKRRILRIE